MAAEEEWRRDITESYGSWSNPDFSFAAARYTNKPYKAVIELLQKNFGVHETTDLNDDVAVILALSGADGLQGLLLSLVGRYAAATENGVLLEVVNDTTVKALLQECGIHFLPRSVLIQDLEFGGDVKSLYEILFSVDGADGLERV